MNNEIEVVTSWDEFREKWTGDPGRQNFLLRGAMFPFQMQVSPLDEVLQALIENNTTRILKFRDIETTEDGSTLAPADSYNELRELPRSEMLDAARQPGVAIAHFDACDLAARGQVFAGLNATFDQWYAKLEQHGFTYDTSGTQRACFYSAPHTNTSYHFDSSFVLVYQAVGRKCFCWLKDPDRWCSHDVLRQQADHYDLMVRPKGITPDDVIECEMGPGDVLWNVMLTPHWVYSLDEPTYSFNLTHFDLACEGELSPIGQALVQLRKERTLATN